jgi:hypothetical protein
VEENLVEDFLIYSALSNLGRQVIKFNSKTDHWFTSFRPNYFHPWLKMKHVTEVLIQYSEISSENVEILSQTITEEIMYCVQGISIKPNLSSGINSFTVYATNNYRKLCVHRYDTVEVMYEDGLKFVQVHGIINIELGNDRSHILLIVHPLKKALKSRTDHLLPFDIYTYDFVYQSCQWDVIEPSMIDRPAILMP